MRSLAPIVLFAYNRPFHTLKTLEALSKNDLADQSTLYIFCDGPKKDISTTNLENIYKTREIVKQQSWAKETIVFENENNIGLASSIIKGVTDVVNKHGKVIVVEDDLLTSPGFLRYMNNALDFYEAEERVMHISGYWFPVEQSAQQLPETFFYRSTSCWGWATWKRSWVKLETDCQYLKKKISLMPDGVKQFNIENAYDHLLQLENNITGRANTWAVKWYATVFLNNGLCLHPNVSLVNNIGFDNSGTHCDASTEFDWPVLSDNINISPVPIEESKMAVQLLKKFYARHNRNIIRKIKKRVLSILKQ